MDVLLFKEKNEIVIIVLVLYIVDNLSFCGAVISPPGPSGGQLLFQLARPLSIIS